MMTTLLVAALLGQVSATPHSQASLLASVTRAVPGQSFLVGFRIKLDPEWHCYWKNPGDSGSATEIKWSVPKGWKVQVLDYPVPEYLIAGGFAIYGYEKEALFLCRVTPPASAKGTGSIKATGDWLVCQDSCVPAKAQVQIKVALGKAPVASATAARLDAEAKALPVSAAGWKVRALRTGKTIDLLLTAPKGAGVADGTRFFASDPATIDHNGKQEIDGRKDSYYVLKLTQSEYAAKPPTRLRGILVAPEGSKWPSGRAIEIDVPISTNS